MSDTSFAFRKLIWQVGVTPFRTKNKELEARRAISADTTAERSRNAHGKTDH